MTFLILSMNGNCTRHKICILCLLCSRAASFFQPQEVEGHQLFLEPRLPLAYWNQWMNEEGKHQFGVFCPFPHDGDEEWSQQ